MPCYGPLTAYWPKGLDSASPLKGAGRLVFDKRQSHSGIAIKVPCGRCAGCKLERSRQWAMRLMHEKRMHKDELCCFVTLTYDNKNLPAGGTLVKRHLQLFMKRLRKASGEGVRFYACGEYGERNARPHYHIILFNCAFLDRKRFSQNGRGDVYYTSDALKMLWPLGHNIIGDVTWDSCAYVARYVLKKITGKPAAEHYAVIDGNGEVFDRLPEFTVMSRRPGIGAGYYDKFGESVRTHDSVVVNGHECKPPRFYDTRFELIDPVAFDKVKVRRRKLAAMSKPDNTSARLRVREVIQLQKLKQLTRDI